MALESISLRRADVFDRKAGVINLGTVFVSKKMFLLLLISVFSLWY